MDRWWSGDAAIVLLEAVLAMQAMQAHPPDVGIASEVAHNLSLHSHLQGQLQGWKEGRQAGRQADRQAGTCVSLSWPAATPPALFPTMLPGRQRRFDKHPYLDVCVWVLVLAFEPLHTAVGLNRKSQLAGPSAEWTIKATGARLSQGGISAAA